MNTGIRLGEVKTSYLEGDFLHIYESKTGSKHIIKADSYTAECCRRCKEAHIAEGSISKKFRELLKDLNLYSSLNGTRSFHRLRDTFVVREYNKSQDIYAVSKMIGHTSIDTTQIYATFDFNKLAYYFLDSMEF
jgi:integrase